METALLAGSTLCFAVVFAVSLRALKKNGRAPAWERFGLMAAGFAMQSAFLYSRGQLHGRCPVTSHYELLAFVAWSVVLIYFMVGPAFRLSLLGLFTAPLVMLFQLVALAIPHDRIPRRQVAPDYWLEMHAALSLVAYGAFALACVAGVMFLIQDRCLRSGRLSVFFYQLPPVHYLTQAIGRLLWLGFVLLSIGIAAGFKMDRAPDNSKLVAITLVWLAYGVLLALQLSRGLGSRKLASASIAAFVFPVITYWFL